VPLRKILKYSQELPWQNKEEKIVLREGERLKEEQRILCCFLGPDFGVAVYRTIKEMVPLYREERCVHKYAEI